jgi:hypothetical protein
MARAQAMQSLFHLRTGHQSARQAATAHPTGTLAAPFSTDRGALGPPMSLRTHPGLIAFTRIPREGADPESSRGEKAAGLPGRRPAHARRGSGDQGRCPGRPDDRGRVRRPQVYGEQDQSNQLYANSNLPALPGFGALLSARGAAAAAAREEFLRWLWSEHRRSSRLRRPSWSRPPRKSSGTAAARSRIAEEPARCTREHTAGSNPCAPTIAPATS